MEREEGYAAYKCQEKQLLSCLLVLRIPVVSGRMDGSAIHYNSDPLLLFLEHGPFIFRDKTNSFKHKEPFPDLTSRENMYVEVKMDIGWFVSTRGDLPL